jgi:hypothetical protein
VGLPAGYCPSYLEQVAADIWIGDTVTRISGAVIILRTALPTRGPPTTMVERIDAQGAIRVLKNQFTTRRASLTEFPDGLSNGQDQRQLRIIRN